MHWQRASRCRENGGAPPSTVVELEAVAEMDPDWIILCPCGLDMDMTVREAQLLVRKPLW